MRPTKILPELPVATAPLPPFPPDATDVICLPWPVTPRPSAEIIPVFLPFAGCPFRCVFCAQDAQSGVAPDTAENTLQSLRNALEQRRRQNRAPAELGFFGGTFTALPPSLRRACLELTQDAIRAGDIRAARCSTRPDAVDAVGLLELADAGFTTVELGIQSFDETALAAARRGYGAKTALAACALVRRAGLTLGVQLLPGMPGVSPEIFLRDVHTALEAGATLLRFYPCQVIGGTALARQWEEGHFTPWSLEETLPALARGWLAAHDAGAAVIRMGLAPEPALAERRLAGPEHPALGSMVQAEALWLAVKRAAAGRLLSGLTVPRHCQGFFWGHRQSLRPRWEALGVVPPVLRWSNEPQVCLHLA